MKIGLVDVDSHNFPNLCLMKLSEYHTRRGDWVEWWNPKGRYDLVYKSRVFTDTYSKDTIEVNNAEQVIQGGTGYGPGGKDLPYEIEHIRPDYFLYPRFLGTAYGFLSRGCPRTADFASSAARRGAGASKSLTCLNFGAVRMRSNCWTPTCWPARTMRRFWNSLPPAGHWWTSPRGWTSG